MVSSTIVIALSPLVVIVAAVAILALAGRGRALKCPDCGTVFASPAMDLKRSGLGWTLPYTGVVKCPKCGQTRGRRDYQKAPSQKLTT
jgi:uncharacterized C2H2 Zn-finger protein